MAIQICDKRHAIIECNSNMIVLGGPGSGKTTIALIKANKEIEHLSQNQKILFLSFARATVARVQESATETISKTSLKSIEINTYHSFFWNILKSHGYLISKISPLSLINPADAAVKMARLATNERKQEFQRIFNEEGIIGFDLFAEKVKEIFSNSRRIREIFSRAYPTVIVDEFQDTNTDEWEVIKLLGQKSRIIALADADQRIYEFRGADPARIGQFITQFNPKSFDFGLENNRSNGTDITTFGNDLLTGVNKGRVYSDVQIVLCPPRRNMHEMFFLKTGVLNAIERLKTQDEWSVAILVPTKNQMLVASNYFSSNKDNLPILNHDVAIDAEGPSLAGALFSFLMESQESAQFCKRTLIRKIINYIRGKNGSSPPAQVDLKLADQLESFLNSGKGRIKILGEIDAIVTARINLLLTGNPLNDWLLVIKILSDNCSHKKLVSIIEDARYVRLLHKGSQLRESLAEAWRRYGCYKNAESFYRDAIQQENFSSTIKKSSGIHIMTIHKSKGKQFDEVFIYEGFYNGRIVPMPTRIDQSRLTLRVAVTRAQKRATILTPQWKVCELL